MQSMTTTTTLCLTGGPVAIRGREFSASVYNGAALEPRHGTASQRVSWFSRIRAHTGLVVVRRCPAAPRRGHTRSDMLHGRSGGSHNTPDGETFHGQLQLMRRGSRKAVASEPN